MQAKLLGLGEFVHIRVAKVGERWEVGGGRTRQGAGDVRAARGAGQHEGAKRRDGPNPVVLRSSAAAGIVTPHTTHITVAIA